MNNPPQNKRDLHGLREVQVTFIVHLHALADGTHLQTGEYTHTFDLSQHIRSLLNQTVKEQQVSYDMALRAILMTWLDTFADNREVQQAVRDEYLNLPDFHASFQPQGTITWVKK